MNIEKIIEGLRGCSCGKVHDAVTRRVEIGKAVLARTGEILRQLGFGDRLHVVCDKNTIRAAAGLEDVLKKAGFVLSFTTFENMTNSESRFVALIEKDSQGADALLAVGTGSLNDLTRYAAYRTQRPYAVFATAPSMDGFVSGVSPLNENGFKRTYPAKAPVAVIADSDILAASPIALKAAGFGDIIGKYTALTDWRVCHILTGEYYCEGLAQLVEDAVAQVCRLTRGLAENDPEASEKLMEALVLSGIAMQLCGNSRPASGSEHHLSHFWEVLHLRDGQPVAYHGVDVGIGCVMITRLYKQLAQKETIQVRDHVPVDEDALRKVYGSLYEEVKKENTPDPMAEVDPQKLKACWPQIREIIAKIPDVDQVVALMRQANACVFPEDAHIEPELVEGAMRYAKYMRRRLTLYRIADLIVD